MCSLCARQHLIRSKDCVACFDVERSHRQRPPRYTLRYGFQKTVALPSAAFLIIQKRMKDFPIATSETCLLGNICDDNNKEEKILPVTPAANHE